MASDLARSCHKTLPGVTHRMVELQGASFHVAEAGPPTGEPVILLHGFPEFWWGWRKQIPVLAEAGFRLIVPDLKGYGHSSAPRQIEPYRLEQLATEIVELAQACGFNRFNLIGHDWGGIIAWAVGGYHALLVKRLMVLNAPNPDVLSSFLRKKPSQLLRSAYIGLFQLPYFPEALLAASDYALLRRAMTSSARPGTFGEEDMQAYRQAWAGQERLSAMLNYYRALVRQPRTPLGRIVPPTLLLWGLQDAALDPQLAEESLLQCANGRLDSHPDATHWVHHEEAEWVNSRLVSFLSEDHEIDCVDSGIPTSPT